MTRFRFTLSELSGALADLGVLLPLVLALITLNGVNAASAFAVIGLAYLVNAFAYRLPIPVQPLKSFNLLYLTIALTSLWLTWEAYHRHSLGIYGLNGLFLSVASFLSWLLWLLYRPFQLG